jgi:hypothetical protein
VWKCREKEREQIDEEYIRREREKQRRLCDKATHSGGDVNGL